ncbi:MAG: gas vesicle protein GvpJ [Bacillota bacterium]
MSVARASQSSSLADVLEKILDKGVVVAGDIKISIADIELLTIKIRLVICSVDKAMEIGINWWQTDPHLNNLAKPEEDKRLSEKIERLEAQLARVTSNLLGV